MFRYRLIRFLFFSITFGLVLSTSVASADDQLTLRLRIAFGGGESRRWFGEMVLGDGSFSDIKPLGIEADEIGSIYIQNRKVIINQRSARAYDGFDITVRAAANQKIAIRMSPLQAKQKPVVTTFTLGELLAARHGVKLDNQSNRLLIRRAPGDLLRVEYQRDHLIFQPTEKFDLQIKPYGFNLAAGSDIRISVEFSDPRGGKTHWTKIHDVKIQANQTALKPIPVSFEMPEAEGVYDVTLTARKWGLKERFNPAGRFVPGKPLATRKIQLIVLKNKAPIPPLIQKTVQKVIYEFNPANPSWWNKVTEIPKLKILPGFHDSPPQHGKISTFNHPKLGRGTQLGKGSWIAYPLSIDQPGQPHELEISYLNNHLQMLGVSIIEPNAAGEVVPAGLDSGVYTSSTDQQKTAQWAKHRVIFWPKTKNPFILLTNQHSSSSAIFGKIRVLSKGVRLQSSALSQTTKSKRLFAGYMRKPLLAENFGASEARDAINGRSLDDWVTFHRSGLRMVDYLKYAGYGGMMLAVNSDGSAIYPSRLLTPTPRYDTGAFFSTAQDPQRKDVLEMLFRIYDRRGLKLIPMLNFSMPLSELEATIRRAGPAAVGIDLIGDDGRRWVSRYGSASGIAPHYNPINTHVQQAMTRVVRELATRYGHHKSFGGISINLSGNGYAILPGTAWALDDDTFAQFRRDEKIPVLSQKQDRFAIRAAAVNGKYRDAWLKWRARRLTAMYQAMQQEVATASTNAKLYLSASEAFDGKVMKKTIRLQLTTQRDLLSDLLTLGIAADQFEKPQNKNIKFLRPYLSTPPWTPWQRATSIGVNQFSGLDRIAANSSKGSLNDHQHHSLRLASFDKKSPFGAAQTYTVLRTHFLPSQEHARKFLVRSLASFDAEEIFDGGWMLPIGQQKPRKEFIDVYRNIPIAKYRKVAGSETPLIVRWAVVGTQTYAYIVNDAPWNVEVKVNFDAPVQFKAKSLSQQNGIGNFNGFVGLNLNWSVTVKPYSVIAVQFDSRRLNFKRVTFSYGKPAGEYLRVQLQKLELRTSKLANPPEMTVLENSDFEKKSAGENIPNWLNSSQKGVSVKIDPNQAASKTKQSIHIHSDGPVSSLVSPLFTVPKSGRLSVLVSLRTNNIQKQPSLRVAIEMTDGTKSDYRVRLVGAKPAVAPLRANWGKFVIPFDQLMMHQTPDGKLPKMRIRFDLMSAGDVWVDQIQLFDLDFRKNERFDFSKIVTMAKFQYRAKRWGRCYQLLEEFWPTFLMESVPATKKERIANDLTEEPPAKVATKPKKPSKSMMDKARDLLPF